VPQKIYVGRELGGQMGGCNGRCVYEMDLINLCTGLSCGQDSNCKAGFTVSHHGYLNFVLNMYGFKRLSLCLSA
jgi:hypothetical protein